MFEVLLFSFSISIDAFGYSLGLGSRNIKISKFDFLILNLINSCILILFFLIYSSIYQIIEKYIFLDKITALLLFCFGLYYFINSFIKVINVKFQKIINIRNFDLVNEQINSLRISDLLLLLVVFMFENAFCTVIFFSQYTNIFFFIISNFIFHYSFFTIGFDLGNKIAKKISGSTPIITGSVFMLLGLLEFFG